MAAGRRITDDTALEVATYVYAGRLNVTVLSALRRHGARPSGCPASTPSWSPPTGARRSRCDSTTARKSWWTSATSGTSSASNPRAIEHLLEGRYVPVVASLAGDAEGATYNVNADTLAEGLAVALRARKLIFLTSSPGLLRDRNDPASLVTFADADDMQRVLRLRRGRGRHAAQGRSLPARGFARCRAHAHRRRPLVRRAAARSVHGRRRGHDDRSPQGIEHGYGNRGRMTPTFDVVRLLADLVAIPSLSGSEAAAVEHVARWCAAAGLPVRTDEAGVTVELPGASARAHAWSSLRISTSSRPGTAGRTRRSTRASRTAFFTAAARRTPRRPSLRCSWRPATWPAPAGPRADGWCCCWRSARNRRIPRCPSSRAAADDSMPPSSASPPGSTSRWRSAASSSPSCTRAASSVMRRTLRRRTRRGGAIESLARDVLQLDSLFASRLHPDSRARRSRRPRRCKPGSRATSRRPSRRRSSDVRTTPD